MRLWTLHPEYLDQKGLCGLWREGIMALNALANPEHGYRKHPQLQRFKSVHQGYLEYYMSTVWFEGRARGYKFNAGNRTITVWPRHRIEVTSGQVLFEVAHLAEKLENRGELGRRDKLLLDLPCYRLNPIFKLNPDDIHIEPWEKVK